MSTFGEQLAAARKAKGYTQAQFAELLHVSRQAVSHWENDRALPDIRTVQQLSQLLDHPFLSADEPPREASGSAPAAASGAAANACPARRQRTWGLLIAGGLCLAALCLVLVYVFLPAPSAQIIVAPLEPVSYLAHSDAFGPGDHVGWLATFSFENASDVPFTPEQVVAVYYEGERIDDKRKLTYAELLRWMDTDKLRRGDSPLHLLFGSDHLNQTHMECVIYGTDDNGHELQFRASVQFSQEYADPQESP